MPFLHIAGKACTCAAKGQEPLKCISAQMLCFVGLPVCSPTLGFSRQSCLEMPGFFLRWTKSHSIRTSAMREGIDGSLLEPSSSSCSEG